MNRSEIINELIDRIDAKSYLEIGYSSGENFERIHCDYKVAVDPEITTKAQIHLTSDDFFSINVEKFDVIFIDGLHHADQVLRDIDNSLRTLNDGGYIICHDMNPLLEEHQRIPYSGENIWNGDCWKALFLSRTQLKDRMKLLYTVNVDHGCAVIQKRTKTDVDDSVDILLNSYLTFKDLEKHRKEMLKLISWDSFMKESLELRVHSYVLDPNNDLKNFKIAKFYDKIGQTASALSFYLRCAERTDNTILKYRCLILAAKVFEKQGTRKFTVKGLLQNAISVAPKRQEAYYYLSRFYEQEPETANNGKWFDSYVTATIGLSNEDHDTIDDLEYPGRYALLFQVAHTSWWCGSCENSKDIFLDLYQNYEMNDLFYNSVKNNLQTMNALPSIEETSALNLYDSSKHSRLKFKFQESEKIEKNYSESYQDMFVLTMLNGKRNGTYLEIGSARPFYGNNTALLEEFEWTGVSIDLEPEFVHDFNNKRKNLCVLRDALAINYDGFLKGNEFNEVIDYLQIDIDPPENSYGVLTSIPFDTYKFRVITFEHDYYTNTSSDIREKSRNLLTNYGYVRVAGNISPDDYRPYEDWWIHPNLVDSNIVINMLKSNDETQNAEGYMLNDK